MENTTIKIPSCILGDSLEELKKIPSSSVDLVIADPPYWKVVGEKWDYQWKTEKEYVEWCIKWISEISRVLRYGGTFYCFGYFRTLALIVPYLSDMELELRQQILIDKGMRSVSGRATKKYKIRNIIILMCYEDTYTHLLNLQKYIKNQTTEHLHLQNALNVSTTDTTYRKKI